MSPSQDHLALVADICDALPVGVWVARAPDGQLVYSNRAFDEIVGRPASKTVRYGGFSEHYGIFRRGGERYPEHQLPFARAIATGQTVVHDDVVFERPDGRHVDVRVRARPIHDATGGIAYVTVTVTDVTREVAAERARAEAERLLRMVIANAPVILFATDAQGLVTVSEGRGLASLGLKPGQLVGQSVFDLYRDHPEILEANRRSMAGETLQNQVQLGEAYLESALGPIIGPDGAITGTVGISVDVTERQRMQQQLVIADRMVSMGMLAASVAHEINNPLTYVTGNLESN